MSYSLTTIWYERQRFLPAILAVAFSAVLVAVQSGLVLGLLSMMSLAVDKYIIIASSPLLFCYSRASGNDDQKAGSG